MSSAPSVPGVEVGAPWLGGCKHALTAGALEMLGALAGTFRPRRAEFFMADVEDEPTGRAHRAGARHVGQGVLVRRHFADSLDRFWHAGLAQHSTRRAAPARLLP